MKKIILSLVVITLMTASSIGATRAYFSDTATITGNTLSTGALELRVNGEPTVVGATFTGVVPVDGFEDGSVSPVYALQNYGPPWFAGPSSVDAKSLVLNVENANDNGSGLWQKVMIRIEVGRLSGAMEHTVYEGKLEDLIDVDLFAGHWSELIVGSTQDMRYTVYLPESGSDQGSLMGSELTWDFVIEARSN